MLLRGISLTIRATGDLALQDMQVSYNVKLSKGKVRFLEAGFS